MYDKQIMGSEAKRLGFIRDTFEKMYRLSDILHDISTDPTLKDKLALKGGTAINLTIFPLPRLSVDIDFDYIGIDRRDELEVAKAKVSEQITGYMRIHGYELNQAASKITHSLHSFVFNYNNAGGNLDHIKVEINYSLRSHILPSQLRSIETLGIFKPTELLCVDPIEIFASKVVALLTRTAMRDLYDISNLLKYGIFNEGDYSMMRKCVVFYAAIAGDPRNTEHCLDLSGLKKIDGITYHKVRTELIPVLSKTDGFNLENAKKAVREFITKLLVLMPEEREFLKSFQESEYRPELLFDGQDLERVRNYPMALWRTRR
jgi:predicted nucleotidyltransferase component of viral defense system